MWSVLRPLIHFSIKNYNLLFAASIQDLFFTALPLCDTSILVSWKPRVNESEESNQFQFSYQEIYGTDLGAEHSSFQTAKPSDGQVKLNNLKENRNYRIIIYEERRDQIPRTRQM